MKPRRALLAAVVLLSSCHAPRASAPTEAPRTRPTAEAPKPAPAKVQARGIGIDDDDLFERAADDETLAEREAELVDLAKKS